jgi:predicted metal-dependent phosphoesterase TrpH
LAIINGEEVETREGEIIGLFLQQQIPKGLSPEETILAIKEQGAVTYLPHPFKQNGNHPWSKKGLEKILPLVDIVEVFNGRLLDQGTNRLAYHMAAETGILMGAGSDAHAPWEVGRAFVDLAEFNSPATFLHNLRHGKIFGRAPSRLGRILVNRFSRKVVRHFLLNQENLPLLKKLWLPF